MNQCSRCACLRPDASLEFAHGVVRCANRPQCDFNYETGMAITELLHARLRTEALILQELERFDSDWSRWR